MSYIITNNTFDFRFFNYSIYILINISQKLLHNFYAILCHYVRKRERNAVLRLKTLV